MAYYQNSAFFPFTQGDIEIGSRFSNLILIRLIILSKYHQSHCIYDIFVDELNVDAQNWLRGRLEANGVGQSFMNTGTGKFLSTAPHCSTGKFKSEQFLIVSRFRISD